MKKTYDVVIAGGGVIGSAIAFYLSKARNLSIALVDVKKKATLRGAQPGACGSLEISWG